MWKNIVNFENYLISDKGEIKSIKTGKIMKPWLNKEGYLTITLKNIYGKRKTFKVHRLVARTFIPNPDNKITVHHIDKNKQNNKINNLEWRTHKEQRAIHFKIKKTEVPVMQMDLENKIIQIWHSQQAASKILDIPRTNINKCCNRKRKTAGGFKWQYVRI